MEDFWPEKSEQENDFDFVFKKKVSGLIWIWKRFETIGSNQR